MYARLKKQLLKYLEHSDIKINGSDPWDIQIHDEALLASLEKDLLEALGAGQQEDSALSGLSI